MQHSDQVPCVKLEIRVDDVVIWSDEALSIEEVVVDEVEVEPADEVAVAWPELEPNDASVGVESDPTDGGEVASICW